jgi:purine-nucleoside phosphorylase
MSYDNAQSTAGYIQQRTPLRPRIGLVLGSGLGAFADELEDAVRIPFADIPNFQKSTALGHSGNLIIGSFAGIPLLAQQGRFHFYEGYSMEQVVFPIRVMAALGVKAIILTNAAGGINEGLEQGCLVILRDHINLMGTNPLVGHNDERLGLRYPDMTIPYDAEYRKIAIREGTRLGVNIHEGVYLAVTGPSYETPAEIRAFATLGADVVGMSTVPEVIVARHASMRVLAISCVTNLAAGRNVEPLTHKEVMETGERVRGMFLELLRAVIPQMAAGLKP